jgi:N-acetylglucosamine-6-phosphate deacetylase
MTSSPAQIAKLSKFLACNGVTAYLPTTVTNGIEAINKAIENVRIAAEIQTDGATIEGVHIEGPYIAHKHKGCHDESKIKLPDIGEYCTFRKIIGEKLILRVTVAPEIQGGTDFIKYVTTHGGFVSIGHSDGYSEAAKMGLASGANSVTHLFNGMTGIHHREPGFAGEGLMSSAYIEVICDKMHIHPDVIRMISRIKSIDEIVLMTDAILATGLGDGEYEFGGFEIKVSGGLAQKADGTIAGSTLTLLKGLKNWVEITGMPLEKALRAATINPARAIGIDSQVGSIEAGKRADLVVLDGNMSIVYTFCRGKKVFRDY